MSSDRVTIEYQLTPADFGRFKQLSQRLSLHGRRPWLMPLLAAGYLGAFALSIWAHHDFSKALGDFWYGLLFFGLVFLFTSPPFIRFSANRQFARLTNLHGATQVTFSADEVEVAGPQGRSATRWTALNRYIIDDEMLLLEQPTNVTYLYPRRAFDPEGWTPVEHWVREKLKPA